MSSPACLQFLALPALDNLLAASKSMALSDWLGYIEALLTESGSILEQEWSFGSTRPDLLLHIENEAQCAIEIHRYIGDLSPQQASDRRLWSYLSIADFSRYTAARWPLDDPSLKERWQGRAEERWLVRSSSRVGLTRNSIARLWWAAAITVDTTLSRPLTARSADPYAYTRYILEKQDRFVSIAEREIGARGEVLFALIEQFELRGNDGSELFARELAKELNLMGGYRELSLLPADEVKVEIANAAQRVEHIISR